VTRKNIYMKARDLEWWIVGFLTLVAFLMAFSGYSMLFASEGIQRNTLDLLYQSIKIFGMDFVDEFSSPVPWQLETARWLAPALLVYAAIKAILYLIRREIKSAFVKYYHDHVIIVGLNEMTRYLVSDLLIHREKVVVVGDIADMRKLDPLEKKGAVIVEGDLPAKNFLRNLGAARAKYFVFLSDDDEKNIEDAITVKNYLAEHGKGRNKTLYTHIPDDIKLNEISGLRLFEDRQLQQVSDNKCDIRIFSAYERAARIIFNKYSPDSFKRIASPDDPPARIAVVGSGSLAQSFILRVARLGHFANLRLTRVTLFQDGDTVIKRLETSFRQIRNFIDLELVDTAPDLFDSEKFRSMHAGDPFSAVYILGDDDAVTSGILNKLSRIDIPEPVNVIAAVNNPESMLSRRVAEKNLAGIELHKFHVTDETFTSEGLISETLDKLAKVVHEDYRSKLKVEDPSRSSHRPWELLPPDFKNQNREQADHILVKLRALGYDTNHKIGSVVVPPEKVELFSHMEHNRWWAFMAMNGWVRGEKRDERMKKHTDLRPYAELTEEIKQSDRNAVLNIPFLLEKYYSLND